MVLSKRSSGTAPRSAKCWASTCFDCPVDHHKARRTERFAWRGRSGDGAVIRLRGRLRQSAVLAAGAAGVKMRTLETAPVIAPESSLASLNRLMQSPSPEGHDVDVEGRCLQRRFG